MKTVLSYRFMMTLAGSLVFEILRQSNNVRLMKPKMCLKVIDSCGIRSATGQQRCPRRAANRLLAVGAIEYRPGLCQCVDMGRFDDRRAIATQLGPQVVDCDKQHIVFAALSRKSCRVPGDHNEAGHDDGKPNP